LSAQKNISGAACLLENAKTPFIYAMFLRIASGDAARNEIFCTKINNPEHRNNLDMKALAEI
jgi:hypothetical protein